MNKYNVPKKEYVKVKDKLENFGGEGDSGSSDVEYWKVKELNDSNDVFSILYKVCNSFKVIQPNNSILIAGGFIASIGVTNPDRITLLAVGFLPFVEAGILCSSLVDYFKIGITGLNPDVYEYLTPITKEEFYDLNNI